MRRPVLGAVYLVRHGADAIAVEVDECRDPQTGQMRCEQLGNQARHPVEGGEILDDRSVLVRRAGLTSLEPTGTLPLDEAACLVREVADQVSVAYGAGVAHRALTPDRILRGSSAAGSAVTVVCGWAGCADELEARRCRAPESQDGPPEAPSPRAQVFTLACLFVALVNGRPAFPGNTEDEIRLRIEDREPDLGSLADVPSVRAVLARALSKEARLRQGDPIELATALVERTRPDAADARYEGPRGDLAPERPPPGPWRRKAVAAVAAVAVAGGAAAVVSSRSALVDDAPLVVDVRAPVDVVTADGRVFVAGAAGVTVIGSDGSAGTIAVGAGAVDLAVEPGGDEICVAVSSGALAVIDVASGLVEPAIAIGGTAKAVAAGAGRCVVAVLDRDRLDAGMVVIVDDAAEPREVPVRGRPIDVAIDGDRVWVLTRSPEALVAIDAGTADAEVPVLLPGDTDPEHVVLSGGDVLVTDARSGAMLRLDGTQITRLPVARSIRGASDDPSRDAVWVAARGPDGLVLVDPASGEHLRTAAVPFLPDDVAPVGNHLWVTDLGANRVTRVVIP